MKILYVTTIASTMNFFTDLIEDLSKHGVEVSILTNTKVKEINPYYMDNHFPIYHVPFSRSIKNINNIQAYKQLTNLLKEKEFDIIHTHTPIASAIVRLACKHLKIKSRVIYTAHGFHFFKGASLKNWLLFYPVEKYLSKYTDDLITINNEDYELAKRKFKAKNIHYVPGVGINLTKFNNQCNFDKKNFRKSLGLDESDTVLIYVAELSNRKNQQMIIEAIKQVIKILPNIKLLLVGDGPNYHLINEYLKQSDLNDYIKLLGFRKDVDKLMRIADILVSSSKQEGLPVNVMEGMAVGLPCIVTDCRGNKDLVDNNLGGIICDQENGVVEMVQAINLLTINNALKEKFSTYNLDRIKTYNLEAIIPKLQSIYFMEG